VISIEAQPGGTYFASAGEDGLLQIWDPINWQSVGGLEGFRQYDNLHLSPDGRITAVSNFENIYLRDFDTYELIHIFSVQYDYPSVIAFSKDSRYLAAETCGTSETTCSYGAIYVWDLQSLQLVNTLFGHGGLIRNLTFIPESQQLLSAGAGDQTLKIWDLITGEVVQTFDEESYITSVAVTSSGEFLATASLLNGVHLWNLRTGERIRTIHTSEYVEHIEC